MILKTFKIKFNNKDKRSFQQSYYNFHNKVRYSLKHLLLGNNESFNGNP